MKFKNLLLLAIMSVALLSCKKDKNGEDNPELSFYRVKSTYYNEGTDVKKTIVLYSDNKVVEIIDLNKNKDSDEQFVESTKGVFTYSGNKVIAVIYKKNGNKWEEDSGYEMTVEDNLLKSQTYKDSKYEYKYSGNNLIESLEFEKGKLNNKKEYFYKDGKVVEMKGYDLDENGGLKHNEKAIYYYTANKLDSTVKSHCNSYDNKWEDRYKYLYQYKGDKVSSYKYLYRNFEKEWQIETHINYEYDEKGFLIKEINLDREGVEIGVVKYEYEKGKGNIESLWYSPNDNNTPNPVRINITKGNKELFKSIIRK